MAYEPASTTLTGTVNIEPSGAIVLRLDQPVDAAPGSPSRDSPNAPEIGQTEIQLIGDLTALNAKHGRHVRVRDTISHAVTIHHVRPLLLSFMAVETINH